MGSQSALTAIFCTEDALPTAVVKSRTGKSVHIYALERGGLKNISKYTPKANESIKNISWCHDNSYLALLQENENPQILSMKDPNHLGLVHTISSVADVTSLRFKSNTKRLLALGTRHGEVMLYDTKNRCVSKSLGQLSGEVTMLEFYSADELVAISNENLVMFNLINSEKVELTNPHTCSALKCLKPTNHIAVGFLTGLVVIWDVEAKCKAQSYCFHSGPITGIVASGRDKLLVTTGADNRMCVIDRTSHSCVFRKILNQPITSIDISRNEQCMVAGLKDGSIYVYQMSDHLKPQICSKMHPTSINQISFINGFSLDLLENDSILEEYECGLMSAVKQTSTENPTLSETPAILESTVEIEHPEVNEGLHLLQESEELEVPEEKVKLDLIKLINAHFCHLEEQLSDHCGRLHILVSNELDSLYAVAARWECFKSMEMDDIVRYIYGIVTAGSDSKILSQKSDEAQLHYNK